MQLEVKLPSLKETSGDDKAADHATLSFFYKGEGDEIEEGEDLVEMVTDKATFNVPCPASGRIVKLCKAEDDVVQVGEVVAVLEVTG